MGRHRKIDIIENEILNGVYSDDQLKDMYEDMSNEDWCSMCRKAHRIVTEGYERFKLLQM